jgi:hypothetical protein
MNAPVAFPKMFRVRQRFSTERVEDLAGKVEKELARLDLHRKVKPGERIAITAGSRGIHSIDRITRGIVDHCHRLGARPFVVPAMGSHGGGTAEGQAGVLARFGITEQTMGCPIVSCMDTVTVCQAAEGFPVHFDRMAFEADHVIVANRVKPHTRFTGAIESGLMKMMLIGLGKHAGAIVYHRVIVNYSFDQIVRSVAREVLSRCRILAGLAILENANEETADMVAVNPNEIERLEPQLLDRAKSFLPRIPFDQVQLLIVDQIGKNISGSGMDTNIIGRKYNDHAATGDERPNVHMIYVRGLTKATHGNAAGIGMAEICRSSLIDQMDRQVTRVNCITAGHVKAAMLPVDFATDREAICVALGQAGWIESQQVPVVWIPNTLRLGEIECSQAYWEQAQSDPQLDIVEPLRPLEFDAQGQLVERFSSE